MQYVEVEEIHPARCNEGYMRAYGVLVAYYARPLFPVLSVRPGDISTSDGMENLGRGTLQQGKKPVRSLG